MGGPTADAGHLLISGRFRHLREFSIASLPFRPSPRVASELLLLTVRITLISGPSKPGLWGDKRKSRQGFLSNLLILAITLDLVWERR